MQISNFLIFAPISFSSTGFVRDNLIRQGWSTYYALWQRNIVSESDLTPDKPLYLSGAVYRSRTFPIRFFPYLLIRELIFHRTVAILVKTSYSTQTNRMLPVGGLKAMWINGCVD